MIPDARMYGQAARPWKISHLWTWAKACVRNPLVMATVIAVVTVSGCGLNEWVHNGFKVGPNYRRPAAPVATDWIDYKDGRVKSTPADLSEWWQAFNDPVL